MEEIKIYTTLHYCASNEKVKLLPITLFLFLCLVNVALGASISTSSHHRHLAQHLVDDLPSTCWVSHSETSPWVALQMQQSYLILGVNMKTMPLAWVTGRLFRHNMAYAMYTQCIIWAKTNQKHQAFIQLANEFCVDIIDGCNDTMTLIKDGFC